MDTNHQTIEENNESMNFDFEEWAALARRDPAAFEARRLEWCERFIQDAPAHYQRRLAGILFQVNMERRRSANAVDSCVRISRMMWDAFYEMRRELQDLIEPARNGLWHSFDATLNRAAPSTGGAEIIPLHSARASALVGNR